MAFSTSCGEAFETFASTRSSVDGSREAKVSLRSIHFPSTSRRPCSPNRERTRALAMALRLSSREKSVKGSLTKGGSMGISWGAMPVEGALYPCTIQPMELVTEPFDVEGAAGERVRGEIRRPAGRGGALPVVFVLHGFKAFRNWGFFPWFGERIAGLGFASVTFDFSHNGTDASGEAYPRKDLFRNMTWATHLADLDALAAALRKGTLPDSARLD